jgi:hypothetical protein
MAGMDGGDSFREMSENLKVDSRAEKIQEYGGKQIALW